eukprot:1191192-Prymnesium_polylepis.2
MGYSGGMTASGTVGGSGAMSQKNTPALAARSGTALWRRQLSELLLNATQNSIRPVAPSCYLVATYSLAELYLRLQLYY